MTQYDNKSNLINIYTENQIFGLSQFYKFFEINYGIKNLNNIIKSSTRYFDFGHKFEKTINLRMINKLNNTNIASKKDEIAFKSKCTFLGSNEMKCI